MNNSWVIYNIFSEEDEYWNNEFGWVRDLASADVFNSEEKENLNLPINGMWAKL